MNWKLRAAVLRCLATVPGGYFVYQTLQRTIGLHTRRSYLEEKLQTIGKILRYAERNRLQIAGSRVVEVGTGWIPLAPLVMGLAGAREIHTYDLHRHLLRANTCRVIDWLCTDWSVIESILESSLRISQAEFCRHWQETRRSLDHFFKRLNIFYHAPANATKTDLAADSCDIHFSISTFEHIPPHTLRRILIEAHRILHANGLAIHIIDPSDHFAHFDPNITSINMLRYDQETWSDIAGHYLAYHNRLRVPQYIDLFSQQHFHVISTEWEVDRKARLALDAGFKVSREFTHFTPDELCAHKLVVCARPDTAQ